MKLDIFIHGVPKGQRIWSTDNCDDQVITLFYGAGDEEQTKYLVDVRKSGNDNYCYYSMLKYQNVSAQDGRAGSYFGITVRMDMVCTKVQIMFHILDLVYFSDILNGILKVDGERLKFQIADFKDVNSVCQKIVDKIMAYLNQSVEGSDFVAITPSMLNGKGCPKLNLSEYSEGKALAYINQGGGFAVSSDYPSLQLAAFVEKKSEEIAKLQAQSKERIDAIQKNETDARHNLEIRYQQKIQEVQSQCADKIDAINGKYANFDAQIKTLEQQIKQVQRQKDELSNEIKKAKKTIEDREKVIARLKQQVENGSSCANDSYVYHKPSIIKSIATKVLPFVNLLIIVGLCVFVILRMPSDNTLAIEEISSELANMKDSMATKNDLLPVPKAISIDNKRLSDEVYDEKNKAKEKKSNGKDSDKAAKNNNKESSPSDKLKNTPPTQ